MSQQTYSRLENAEKVFTDELIEKISNLFSITSADFERPLDASLNIYNNSATNINSIDIEVFKSMQSLYERHIALLEKIIADKA